jgi:predicted RNA binding protein YcfA (HicA-like mRNA interferase family)
MISLVKIEIMKDDLVKFSEDEYSHYFISKDSNEIEHYLNNYGWQLHRSKGYSVVAFKRNEEEILVTPKGIWNFKYWILIIPKEYMD